MPIEIIAAYSHHAPAPAFFYINSRPSSSFRLSSSCRRLDYSHHHGKPLPYPTTHLPASLYTPPLSSQGVTIERISPGDSKTYPKRGGMIPLSIIFIFLLSIHIRLCHNSLRGDTHRWEEIRFQSRPVRVCVIDHPPRTH